MGALDETADGTDGTINWGAVTGVIVIDRRETPAAAGAEELVAEPRTAEDAPSPEFTEATPRDRARTPPRTAEGDESLDAAGVSEPVEPEEPVVSA